MSLVGQSHGTGVGGGIMPKPKLLDQIRDIARLRHLSLRTEEIYVHRIRRFIFFNDERHPLEMSGPGNSSLFLSLGRYR